MTVIATIDEINNVLQYFNPNFPKQNLEIIRTNECFYSLNSVGVEVVIVNKEEDSRVN
jgi:malic enzyme